MEYSTHVFIQQLPLTEQNFDSKFQDISNQITTNGYNCPNVFAPFTNLAVKQAVVSSRYIAFLLQDGRICRVSFRIQGDKIEGNQTEIVKDRSKDAHSQIKRSHARHPIHRSYNFDRPNFENLILSSTNSSHIPAPNLTNPNPNPTAHIDLLPQIHAGYPLRRSRQHLIRAPNGRTGIIFGPRSLIPASNVPEDLIEQVQVVLQGKSRNIILRELQRTNLDVNMAVNNLLARDDDGDDDFDDEYSGTDLISLLDVNPNNDHHGIILESELFDDAEFAIRYSTVQRRVLSARIGSIGLITDDEDEFELNNTDQLNTPVIPNPSIIIPPSATIHDRDRKRSRYDPRWLDGSLREELFGRIDRELKPDDLSLIKDSNIKINRKDINPPTYQHQNSTLPSITTNSSVSSTSNPIVFGDQLQFWIDFNADNNTYPRFTHIACLHSELIAINTKGQLCQWNWHDDYPYQDIDNSHIKHPKTVALQIFNEKLIDLSANSIRASVLTETNRLATWIDESLGVQVNNKLQHSAQEFSSLRIIDIRTSPLFTIFRADSNDLYWYGLLPNKPRKKLLERLKDKTRHKNRSNNQQQTITVGCSVCLISNPYYHQGAWAFFIRDGQPKLGQLMEQAWILSKTARFRIKTFDLTSNKIKDDDRSSLEMPPPPSPASSTCSIDSNTSFPSSLKRKKTTTNNIPIGSNSFPSIINDNDSTDYEEHWPLDEVIFIEDCKLTPIGKVVKIDGSLVLVKFSSKTNNETNDETNNLDNCRILRKDDLQVVKGNQAPKTPDCTIALANAKRISLENGSLLSYSVDKDHLYTLQVRDSTAYYFIYEIGSNNGLCRSIRQNALPLINNRQSLTTFLGKNVNSINLSTFHSNHIPHLLIDGNRLIYPFVSNNDNTNFKDPQWKNLSSMNYFSQGLISTKQNKNSILINIMQFEKGLLIPHILRYDVDKIHNILNEIELNQNKDLLKLILDERIDGCRNIFHACVHISIPTTNRECVINGEQIPNDVNGNVKRISFSTDAVQSQANIDHNYVSTRNANLNDQSSKIINESIVQMNTQTLSDLSTNVYKNSTNMNSDLFSTIQNCQFHSTHTNSNDFSVWSTCQYDEREKRIRSMKILRLLLDHPLFQEHLLSLLSFRNIEGHTPFMSAIHFRAYNCASILLDYVLKLSQINSVQFHLDSSTCESTKLSSQNILLRTIYPSSSILSDCSPLYTLCTNDTCSFTWTGEEHISQTIYECKTCGLSGTLCCCSECAQTCHKGHDCRLKRTSPTAYCDCWEICKCKSLISGDQEKRLELFKRLLNETNLIEIRNPRYENILLYLVQTVSRQLIEQQQFSRTSTSTILQQHVRKAREHLIQQTTNVNSTNKKMSNQFMTNNQMNSNVSEINVPDHNLEPPQFCRRALELMLADWPSVKSMLLCGCPENFDLNQSNTRKQETSFCNSTMLPTMSLYNNDNETIFSLDNQEQTSQLDRFTYFLIVKCNTMKTTTNIELLDVLLNTLLREMSNSNHCHMARYVATRFVRSVIRLFIIVSLQNVPDKCSTIPITTTKRLNTNSNLSSTYNTLQTIVRQCKRIFQTLIFISINSLVNIADLLIGPVRHGIAKPTGLINLLSTHTDVLQGLDEVFNINSEYSHLYQRNTNSIVNNNQLNETDNDNITLNTNLELIEDDDNVSDTQSQNEINNNLNTSERQSIVRDHVVHETSDNESEIELELLAESESDNESNHSTLNRNTQQTNAPVTNENLGLFSDDDNSESDDDDDSVHSDSVLGEGDDINQPESMLFDDATRDTLPIPTNERLALESTSTNNNSSGNNTQNLNSMSSNLNVPRLISRTATNASLFGETISRRQITPIGTNLSQSTNVQQQNIMNSVNTTNSLLARAFGILIRQTTDLLIRLPITLSTTNEDSHRIHHIQNEIEQCLLASWQWFATVMDSFESQIRFGMTLSNLTHNENDTTFYGNRFLKNLLDRTQIETKKKSTNTRTNNLTSNVSKDRPINNRLDFLNYTLSVMRSTYEHGDQEPLIDALSHKHLAYLLDAFIYYFREHGLNEIIQIDKNSKDRKENNDHVTSNDPFFRRSSSTLCLSSLGPDPFQITIDESLPLACRPQLLQPICRKEDLFGRFLLNQTAEKYSNLSPQLGLSRQQRSIPEFLRPNYLNLFHQIRKNDIEHRTNMKADDNDRTNVDVLLDSTPDSILLHGSYEYLLVRWRFSIELFSKLFLDDVGNEPGSIINESSGFSAREQRFRHDMEKIRNAHQKDIRFEGMERDRILLIQKTFRTLNSYYYRNQNVNSSSSIPPLAVQRVKVTFKDEPGEGSGVARSFYASIVEAILSEDKLPVLELGAYGISSAMQPTVNSSTVSHAQRQHRISRERRSLLAAFSRSDRRSSSVFLSSDARPFKFNELSSTTIQSNSSSIEHWTPSKIKLGLMIYPKVALIQPYHAEKITGMLLECLSTPHLQRMIHVEEDLRMKIDEAMNILTLANTQQQNATINEQLINMKTNSYDKQLNEYVPLFWQPDKKGVYAPRPGKCTPERLTAYRNIGRLIGLCLLQNELFPLSLCRHVIKYILNRTIRWHDLAFFDSTMYENLRRTAYETEKIGAQYIDSLHLTFSMTVTEKEGGETYDLIPDGSLKDVTCSNLYEFIKRYAEFRMIHLVEQSLQHLRFGVYDVLPSTSLDYLSSEDFRLLLNGTSNINITTLMTYTTFNDESGDTNERINQFKKWFWSVLGKLNPVEKQDLVYFWTGSPALPASEAGFQPQPSVTIRPADDQHLPTANTCISRLYVPLYSSKTILKSKLLYAIKTKMFGFV